MNKVKVLIVDDSAVVRQTMKDVLESDPHIEVIAVAQDPFVGAEKIRKVVPDVITLDVEMPRMDGLQVLQVLRRVRGVDRRDLPPIIVLTSSERDEDIAQAYQLGAQSYICKPMSYPEFADTVCDTLEYWLGLNRPIPKRVEGVLPPDAGCGSKVPE